MQKKILFNYIIKENGLYIREVYDIIFEKITRKSKIEHINTNIKNLHDYNNHKKELKNKSATQKIFYAIKHDINKIKGEK